MNLKVSTDYAGHTEDVVNNVLFDVTDELREFLKNGGKVGSEEHVELSDRVKTISTLACA